MAELLSAEQVAAFKAKLEAITSKQVAEAQANVGWLKETIGASLSRTDAGTVKVAVYSPFTGREVIALTFPIRRTAERSYLETIVANIQPKVMGAFAEDYLDERLKAELRL